MARPPEPAEDFTEVELISRLAFEGRLLRIRADRVRLHDGTEANREYVEHPGAVMVLAFLDPATILLERQFRYPKRRHFIELPAGKLDAGEAALDTARRELVEECGYEAAEWWKVATIDPCIGYSNEVIHLYGARGLTDVGAKLDAGEHLEVFPAKVADAIEWVRDGIITDTKTMIGLLWLAQFGARESQGGLPA